MNWWGRGGDHIPHTPAIPLLSKYFGASLTQVDKETCPRMFLEASAEMPTHKRIDKSQVAYANDEHHGAVQWNELE